MIASTPQIRFNTGTPIIVAIHPPFEGAYHYAGAIYCAPTIIASIIIASRIVNHASCIVHRASPIVHL